MRMISSASSSTNHRGGSSSKDVDRTPPPFPRKRKRSRALWTTTALLTVSLSCGSVSVAAAAASQPPPLRPAGSLRGRYAFESSTDLADGTRRRLQPLSWDINQKIDGDEDDIQVLTGRIQPDPSSSSHLMENTNDNDPGTQQNGIKEYPEDEATGRELAEDASTQATDNQLEEEEELFQVELTQDNHNNNNNNNNNKTEDIKQTTDGRGSTSTSSATTTTTTTSSSNKNSGNNKMVLANSNSFVTGFGIILLLIVLFRFLMLFFLIKHRHHGNLMLAQPVVLAILMVAGTISIASSFLLVHIQNWDPSIGDIFCLLRDPMIITPLTLAGCILLGRVWRIVLLLTPVLQLQEEERSCSGIFQRQIMMVLTTMADTYHNFAMCYHCSKYYCYTQLLAEITRQPLHTKTNHKHNYSKRRQKANMSKSIRRKIPLFTLLWLIFLLMIPQLLLQACNLIVPVMQERLQITTYTQIQIQQPSDTPHQRDSSLLQLSSPSTSSSSWTLDTLVYPSDATIELTLVEKWTCSTQTGSAWPTYLGVVFMLIPYCAAAFLAWTSQDELPKVFDEAKATTRSFKVLAIVIAVALPPLLWQGTSTEPDTYVYLTSTLIFAIVSPPCWFVVYPKVWEAFIQNAPASIGHIRRLLRDDSGHTHTHSVNTNNQQEDANGKAAKLALTIGKMYEDMGMHSKSLDLFDEALAVWQVDPARHSKDQIGGFTQDEIDSFSVSDLECIIQLLIAKGRVNGTFKVEEKKGQKHAAQAWLDALEVYEVAPARAGMKDRSMLFPVFSGLFVFLKGGKIKDDEKHNFEQNLARKFVRETKLQGDPVHYTRALAMMCEVKGRLGKYKAAMESYDILKSVYDAEEHSAAISEAYGTDRSAQAFSQCAMWHMDMGNMDLALRQCEYVLDELMYLMDPANVLNLNEMLLPILRVYREAGGYEERMRNIFDKYVIQNHEKHFVKHGKASPCAPALKPLLMLLQIYACGKDNPIPDFEDAVEFMMPEEGGVASDFVDSIYTKLCWAPHSVSAELCLLLAKQLVAQRGDIADTEALVVKGINLCQKTEKKTRDAEGKIILKFAYGIHEPLYKELRDLAASLNIEYVSDLVSGMPRVPSALDAKNLPNSFRKSRSSSKRSSDGGSSSERSPKVLEARTSILSFASGSRSTGSRSGESKSAGSNDSSTEERAPPNGFLTKSYVDRRRNSLASRVSEISMDSKLRSMVEDDKRSTLDSSVMDDEKLDMVTFSSTELGESLTKTISTVEAPFSSTEFGDSMHKTTSTMEAPPEDEGSEGPIVF